MFRSTPVPCVGLQIPPEGLPPLLEDVQLRRVVARGHDCPEVGHTSVGGGWGAHKCGAEIGMCGRGGGGG